MRNNKMKGFTLVELLVVIAILAILATVSVVGYTSFIKSAYISNDENIAAQLNQFMVALKADSDGDFYDELQASGGKVTVDNVREITDYILNDSGLGTLVPQSAEYGYHFYFDLDAQEYVLIGDDDPRILGMSPLGRLFAGAISQSQTAYPESCFTEGGRYFLVETGTKLADVVALFKTVTDLESLNNLFTEVDGFRTNKGEQLKALVDFVKDSVFVTKDGTFVYDVTMAHKHLFIFPGATQIGNTKVSFVNTANTASINAEHPLITVDKDITITVPAGVTPLSNSMIIGGGNNATIVIDANGWNADPTTKLSELADANFTTADTTIVVAGVEYKLVGGTKVYTKVADGDGDHVANLGYNGSPVTSFDITCAEDASSDKLLLDGNYLYVAYDYTGNITLGGTNFNNGGIVSSENLTWGDPSNGIIVKNADGTYNIGIIPKVGAEGGYAATITATAEAGGYEKSIQVYVVRPLDVTYTLEGELDGVITYNGNNNKYVFSVPTVTFNPNGKVTCNDDVTITTSGDLFSIGIEEGRYVLTLNKNVEGGFDGKSQTFTVTAGTGDGKITSTKTISVNDVSAEPFSIVAPFDTTFTTIVDGTTYQTPYRVGNKNTVTLNTFFTTTKAASSTTLTVSTISGTATATATGMTEDGSLAVTNTAWNSDTNIPLSFSGTGVVALSLGGNTVRLEVVDGYNVKSYSDITSNSLSNSGKNIVFLDNITMPEGDDTAQLYLKNAILFGNGFKFDVTNGYFKGSGRVTSNYVICLVNGTLNNVEIEGRAIDSVAVTADKSENTCTVLSTGNDTIANCFISGNGSPVRMCDADLKIINTTLSGGSLANLELRNGNIILENVTTINQFDGSVKGSVGMGIISWYESVGSLSITIKGTLTQYNYVTEQQIRNMDIKFYGVSITGKLADKIFDDPSVSDKFVSGDWVNMGIVLLNTSFIGSENISDLRTTNNYEGSTVSLGDNNGYVYTMGKSAVTYTDSPAYQSKGQYHIEATSKFDDTQIKDSKDGATDNNFCYIENGKLVISFDQFDADGNANSITKDFNGFCVPTENGKSFAVTEVTLDGNSLKNFTATFSATGEHVLEFTFEEGKNYHNDGQYTVKYTVRIDVSVTAVKPDAKHAEFEFKDGTATENITIGDKTYVSAVDVSATDKSWGYITVNGTNIYYPITEAQFKKATLKSEYTVYYYVFNGTITITDYKDGGTGAQVIYNASTKTKPSNLTVINGMEAKYTSISNACVNISNLTKDGPSGEVWNFSRETQIADTTTYNNYLAYQSPSGTTINGEKRNYDAITVAQFCYTDEAGATYYYFVGYYMPNQNSSSGDSGGSDPCFAPDTLITLADGTQKRIDELTFGDKILAWDFFTGTYVEKEISLHVNHGLKENDVIYTKYSDGTLLKLVGIHGVFDYDLNKFVYITPENVQEYIGHRFVKQNLNGGYDIVTMTEGYVIREYVESWSVSSAVTSNAFASGLLTVAPPEDFYNWVTMDGKLRYDAEQFAKDVETYGLYTYEDFKDYVTYEQFVAWNGAYLKIPVEKGYFTFEYILELIELYKGWMPQN